jgi:hypothetical protein
MVIDAQAVVARKIQKIFSTERCSADNNVQSIQPAPIAKATSGDQHAPLIVIPGFTAHKHSSCDVAKMVKAQMDYIGIVTCQRCAATTRWEARSLRAQRIEVTMSRCNAPTTWWWNTLHTRTVHVQTYSHRKTPERLPRIVTRGGGSWRRPVPAQNYMKRLRDFRRSAGRLVLAARDGKFCVSTAVLI